MTLLLLIPRMAVTTHIYDTLLEKIQGLRFQDVTVWSGEENDIDNQRYLIREFDWKLLNGMIY